MGGKLHPCHPERSEAQEPAFVSFLRLVPLKCFWYPGNYTQHQETRFHKIIATERSIIPPCHPDRGAAEWRDLAHALIHSYIYTNENQRF
jgi:hypothetical protein